MAGFRLPHGGLIARDATLPFVFDGKPFAGHPGDTLASALLASGVRLFGRSFKYHRPRGVVTAGFEEPCALVELRAGARREPNIPAPAIELFAGLVAASQNRWPSLAFDAMAVNGLLGAVLPAGFYYKTFMWPSAFWEKVYEPAIRRAAGLGRLSDLPDPDAYETEHVHVDTLVVGSGAAGLSAALALGEAGARVLLLEQDWLLGGGTLVDPQAAAWRADRIARLERLPNVVIRLRTAAVGAYDHGVTAAVERVADHLPEPAPHQPRQRLLVIRARRAVIATGASERIVAFPDNDRPGVMLSGAARAYATRFGVAVGRRVAVFAANDDAYATAHDLAAAGVEIAAIVDPRRGGVAAEAARAAGLPVLEGHEVAGVSAGRDGVHGVHVRPVGGSTAEYLSADALLVSGGHTPNVALLSQARVPLVWCDRLNAFAPNPKAGSDIVAAGAANAVTGLADAAADGWRAGAALARSLGLDAPADTGPHAPATSQESAAAPLWEVSAKGKAFVDLQHDATAEDIRLAHREGFTHVEHAKRYTTHGMGTDQGRIGGLTGVAILAEARGEPIAKVGLPTYRPYAVPTSWGALAGAEVGHHFKPTRRLALHDRHAELGAVFVATGLWLRPLVYSGGDTSWGPVIEEARHVRSAVGICDGSTFGKIDIQGPDAARFLDLVYANTISTLAVGKCRYGLMLREDGLLFDDGTVARLGERHFVITTTTAKSADALLHLEWHRQAVWPDLDVVLTSVADHWAQIAVAGPKSRAVLERFLPDLDLSNDALPFMGVVETRVGGRPLRVFRISFSGELAYEIAVPAKHASWLWDGLLEAGKPEGIRPYGLDALNLMRIEKGHVTGAEINGQTTAGDLGLGRMLKKSGDFIGRHLANRPGLVDPARQRLVGLRALDPTKRLRNGMHVVAPDALDTSLGSITSCCPSVVREGWIALALVENGPERIGQRLLARSVLHGETVEVELASHHLHDPENHLVRA